MKRREFIQNNMAAALGFAFAGAGVLAPWSAGADKAADVVVAKGEAGPAARAAIDMLGGMGAVVKKGDKVALKPNMSFPHPPERATTTHPEVVREVASMCREAGAASVLVLDHPLRAAEMCLERSGIKSACRGFDENMVRGLDSPSFFKTVDFPEAHEMRKNDVMLDVLDADVLIALPVAKSHGSAGVSLSMKGMMGLIYNRGVMHYRYDLHEAIVDLNTFLRADLAVIDGTRVLTTNGPGGPGEVHVKNTVIASRDFVAADATAVASFEWWGRRMRPDQVKHIRSAHERGLGRMDIHNLTTREISV